MRIAPVSRSSSHMNCGVRSMYGLSWLGMAKNGWCRVALKVVGFRQSSFSGTSAQVSNRYRWGFSPRQISVFVVILAENFRAHVHHAPNLFLLTVMPSDAATPRGDCVSSVNSPQHRLRVCGSRASDHLRRPRDALGLPAHAPSRKPAAPLRLRRSSRVERRGFDGV